QLERAAPPNLSLRPPVFGSDKDEALRRSTLFILPSRWEGLSMSLAEALAAGVPCAVSTEVAATLPVAAEGLGLVLDRDPDAAAEALRSAIDDPAHLRRWSHAGAAFAADHFDPEVVAQRTLGTYATAAAGSR
ncbi:MAG: glycosyltransferase family 4 protein, partial [Acidimicrobiales bacterium]